MRVLLIEDDSATAKSIANLLNADGFTCDTTDLGEDAIEIGRIYEYDLIILDLMLPDINGYEVLRQLRIAHIQTPALVLSGLRNTEDKVKGLGCGADDYLTKPFSRSELLARAHAIIRRSKGHSMSMIRIGRLQVNLQNRTACVDAKLLNLTSKEYSILELLALRKGTTISKEVFLNHLYGGMDEPEVKIIDVFVCKLRRKLFEATGEEGCIETVWGRGYLLREPNSQSFDRETAEDEIFSPLPPLLDSRQTQISVQSPFKSTPS
jgi:two-component system cell cycle response regulator CtrA